MKTRQPMTAARCLAASLAVFLLFITGCATTSSHDAQLRALGVQQFGTDANLKVHYVFYSGPSGNTLSDDSEDQAALIVDLKTALTRKVDLVVSCESSRHAAANIWAALHDPAFHNGGLQQLRLLFVGDQRDADKLKPIVEATGATFYFQQKQGAS